MNEGLVVCVGLREICSGLDRAAAGRRALEAFAAAARRAVLLEPIRVSLRRVNHDVAVLGAGLAGMQAALDVAALGHRVVLLEKKHAPVRNTPGQGLGYLGEDSAVASKEALAKLGALAEQVGSHSLVRFMPGHEVRRVTGDFGNFKVHAAHNGKERVVRAGAVILAFGREREPVWPHGVKPRHGRMISLSNLLERMTAGVNGIPGRVAFLMGVTSEADSTQSASVWGAAETLASRRGAHIVVYCRNVQVAATGLEQLYRRARARGVLAIKFEAPPIVLESCDNVMVQAGDVEESFDWLVIADARARQTAWPIAGLRPGPTGLGQADNVWLLPVESNRMGVAVIGDARAASEWRESLQDASAAAGLAHAWLAGGKVEVRNDAARVDTEKCVCCLTCVRTCPHAAIDLDKSNSAVKISDLSCRRCGLCAAVCPAQAIQLPQYTDAQMAAELEQLQHVAVFACENSAFPASGLVMDVDMPAMRLIRVPCIGRVDAVQVLSAFEQGASRVCVFGCHKEACRYITGSSHAAARMAGLRDAMQRSGLDPERLIMGHMTEFEPRVFAELVSKNENTSQGSQSSQR